MTTIQFYCMAADGLSKAKRLRLERLRAVYANDVAIQPPNVIASIIESGGFETPVQFFRGGLIHTWFSMRVSGNVT